MQQVMQGKLKKKSTIIVYKMWSCGFNNIESMCSNTNWSEKTQKKWTERACLSVHFQMQLCMSQSTMQTQYVYLLTDPNKFLTLDIAQFVSIELKQVIS